MPASARFLLHTHTHTHTHTVTPAADASPHAPDPPAASALRRHAAFGFALPLGVCLLSLCLCLYLFVFPLAGDAPARLSYEVGFSPRGDSQHVILKAIKGAKRSIRMAAYSFTSKPIAKALVKAHKRGVTVHVLADKRGNSGRHSVVGFLAARGVPTRVNRRYSIFHHKFIVIDGRHLETGSFNYSAAAVNKNAENVLLLRDVPALAGRYAREWEKLWREGEAVEAGRPPGKARHAADLK